MAQSRFHCITYKVHARCQLQGVGNAITTVPRPYLQKPDLTLGANHELNVEGPGPEPENLQHPFEFHGRVPADGWVQRRGNAIGNGKRRDAGRVEMGICPLPETQLTLHHEGIAVDLEANRSEEHTSELQSRPHLVCRLL